MPKGTPSLLYSAPCEAGFDAEKFLSLARSVFSNVSAGDGRIRSGRHIPRGFKNLVSSYKIIGSHSPLMNWYWVVSESVTSSSGNSNAMARTVGTPVSWASRQ